MLILLICLIPYWIIAQEPAAPKKPIMNPKELKVLKTIKLHPADAESLRYEMKNANIDIGGPADRMMFDRGFTVTKEERSVDLVVMKITDLGFKKEAYLVEIYTRAKKLGLEICPTDVAPQLLLQYSDMPNGDELIICTKPLFDSEERELSLFFVAHNDDGLLLGNVSSILDYTFDQRDFLVFVLPHKKLDRKS